MDNETKFSVSLVCAIAIVFCTAIVCVLAGSIAANSKEIEFAKAGLSQRVVSIPSYSPVVVWQRDFVEPLIESTKK